MRRLIFVFVILAVATVVFKIAFLDGGEDVMPISGQVQNHDDKPAQGLPWQVNIVDHTVQVFSLTLGQSTLQQAIDLVGDDFELAVMARTKEQGSLELYFPLFTSGRLKGKLVVVADLNADEIANFIDNARKVKHLETGVKKYAFFPAQYPQLMNTTIKAITFAPVAGLNDELVRTRFGEPQSVKVIDDKIRHYLYPQKGMVVIVNQSGKDFVEYSPLDM